MNLLVVRNNKILSFLENSKSEYLGFYFSFVLHLILLVLAIGLPNFFEPEKPLLPAIIPIEIINVSDVTSIPKDIKDNKSSEIKEKKIEVKEKKFNSSENQEINKIEIKDQKKIQNTKVEKIIEPKTQKVVSSKKDITINEKKEIPIELEKEKIKIETNDFESLPTKKIKPKLKPKPKKLEQIVNSDVSVEPKPKPSLKTEIVKDNNFKPKPKPEPEFNIASMLKDLRNEKSTPKSDNETKKDKDENINTNDKPIAEEEAQLSISEIDLVLQQLRQCFISPAGAKIKKTMFVKISAKIQKNRKVLENSIRIVDTNIPKSSPVYGPITESAMRTLLNPECIPLKLPEDKYDFWKNLTINFDYSVMRGS